MSKPSEVIELGDGWIEERYWRKSSSPNRGQALIRKRRDPNGVLREVWHEAWDRAGQLVHQHQLYPEETEQQP